MGLLVAASALVACNYVLSLPPQPLVDPVSDGYLFNPEPPAPPTIPCRIPDLLPGQTAVSWPASTWVVAAQTAGAKTAPLFNPKSLTPHASRRAPVGAMCDCLGAVQSMGHVYCRVPRALDLDQWPQLARCTPNNSKT